MSSNLNRRAFLAASAAGAALTLAPEAASAAQSPKAKFDQLLATFAEEILRLAPEQATTLGVDTGKRAPLKAQLADTSEKGRSRWAAQVGSMIRRIDKIDRTKLSPADQTRLDTVRYAAERGQEGAAFSFGAGASGGFFGGAAPYVISQQDGAITQLPEFLNSQHKITAAEDAEAYLDRVSAMALRLDEETAKLKADASRGVVPPAFVAATALKQLKQFRATPAAEQTLVTSIAERAKKAGLGEAWGARAEAAVLKGVYPALDRQIAAFEAATRKAPETAGVQRLPDGEAYYAWGLRLGTTTTIPAAEIHRIGLEQNKAIQAKMDAILKAQGLTQGSVGERAQALNQQPSQLYPNTEEGRAALIAYIESWVGKTKALMPTLSNLGLKAPVEVKRVPVDIEDGAPLGYMNFASLDGSRPAIYYVNLKTTALWPKYQLATLTAHEATPGHAWQGAYLAERNAEIPLISSLMGFNAFTEGWALYAEQLVDEAGLYADDPWSQLGYLQAQQFRACRLVVDTGLHALGWTRDQSVQFLVQETGRGVEAMTSETDRYCVSPGQACGYKMGHNELLRLREKAKTAMGARFSLAAFNDAVVSTGGVPLSVLEQVIDRAIAAA